MRNFFIKNNTYKFNKELYIENLLNNTDKVTKVSQNTILSGIAFATAKVATKAEKDLGIYFSRLLPDYSSGQDLDISASILGGIDNRLSALQSTTFVRVVTEPSTIYLASSVVFQSDSGINFTILDDFTVNEYGYGYIQVRSVEYGEQSNVQSFQINSGSGLPVGHQYVTNEFQATGGRDMESDDSLRKRIKEGPNVNSKSTLSSLEQAFLYYNPRIYKLFHNGIDDVGKTVISVMSQDGSFFTEEEFEDLLQNSNKYLAITDYRPSSKKFYGVKLINSPIFNIDISFRIEMDGSVPSSEIRQEIQRKISNVIKLKYVESENSRFEWDDILQSVKNCQGIKYVSDESFSPKVDLSIPKFHIPRIRGFRMLNMSGGLISDISNELAPIYYPIVSDFYFQNKLV
jgi:phage-related baseplate assembly protein